VPRFKFWRRHWEYALHRLKHDGLYFQCITTYAFKQISQMALETREGLNISHCVSQSIVVCKMRLLMFIFVSFYCNFRRIYCHDCLAVHSPSLD